MHQKKLEFYYNLLLIQLIKNDKIIILILIIKIAHLLKIFIITVKNNLTNNIALKYNI